MSLTRKYPDALLAALFAVATLIGCQDKNTTAPTPAQPPAPATKVAPAPPAVDAVDGDEQLDPKAELEVACFEGDQSACDELGH